MATTSRGTSNIKTHTPSVVGAAMLLGATALASRVLGLMRDRLLAGTFGAGADLDAYYAAFRIPDLVYTFLVLGALSAGFIPIFTKRLRDGRLRDDARLFANRIVNMMGVGLVIASCVGIVWTRSWLGLVAPGVAPEVIDAAVPLSRLLYIATIFLGLSSVFGGMLQGLKRFLLYAIAPLLYNIGIIVGAVVAQQTGAGIVAIVWGVIGGAAAHLLLQTIGAWREGWRYAWAFGWRDADVRQLFSLMGPRVVGLAIAQINLIAMTAIASWLARGSITIFHFANNIQYVPIGIIGISFAIAAFPQMSAYAAERNDRALSDLVSETTRLIVFLIVPVSVVFLLLRAQIVRVVLGAGAFGWNETIVTADALAFFALSLFAQALVPLFVRVFFAFNNTVLPALIGLLSAMVNIGLAVLWSPLYGVIGIAMAFSAASILQGALLWAAARVYVRDMQEARLLRTCVIALGGAVLAGVMIQATKELFAAIVPLRTFVAVLGQGLAAGGAGLIVYAIIAWAFQSEEWEWLAQTVHRRWFALYRPIASADEAVEMTN